MNIIEAAKALNEGKEIRRPNWIPGFAIHVEEDSSTKKDTIHNFIITTFYEDRFDEWEPEDLLADDWEVVG